MGHDVYFYAQIFGGYATHKQRENKRIHPQTDGFGHLSLFQHCISLQFKIFIHPRDYRTSDKSSLSEKLFCDIKSYLKQRSDLELSNYDVVLWHSPF